MMRLVRQRAERTAAKRNSVTTMMRFQSEMTRQFMKRCVRTGITCFD